jgi:hypothetical protein
VRRRRRAPLLVALVLAVVALAGCEVRTEVGIDVHEDGSGTVQIGLGLDDDALDRVPGIADELRIDDLRQAGWTVTGPAREADGLTWFRVTKPFGTAEEAGRILDEVAGTDGPFRSFRITRERSFARTRFGFTGDVDFAAGLESYSDPALTDALDGQPLGEAVADIERRIGASIDRVFTFRIAVRLPGDVSSNAPTKAGNGAVWQPRLSEPGPVHLEASSTTTRWSTILLTALAVAAAVAAVAILAWRPARRRRRRRAAHAA